MPPGMMDLEGGEADGVGRTALRRDDDYAWWCALVGSRSPQLIGLAQIALGVLFLTAALGKIGVNPAVLSATGGSA